ITHILEGALFVQYVDAPLCFQKTAFLARRTFTTSARQLRNKVPEAQKLFQEDNGLPVHIKGGTSDVMLYRATMILSGIGTCYSLYWLLLAAAPQKNA
uniref:Cytochrome c oxidase subunit 7A1, mitochondrial n=1 Tax=Takifugu rubripes TaxID=31033 RepID=A0A674PE78_TAKRU